MFIEKLTTPCYGAGDTAGAKPLVEALDSIASDYNTANYDAKVELAYKVASLVRHSLRFKNDRGDSDYLSPENLTSRPVTNCHGFSVVTSECLDQVGIDHYVGFSNCHSFVVLQDKLSGRTNLVDTADKPLCTDISGAIIDEKRLLAGEQGRGTLHKMLGSEILRSAVFENGLADNKERGWLGFGTSSTGYPTKSSGSDGLSDSILLMRAYQPTQGRNTVLNFSSFRHAMLVGDQVRAHDFLSKMAGVYPEVDKRNKLSLPTELIKFLGRGCFEAEAMADIDAVEQSFAGFGGEHTVQLWSADRRRDVGNHLHSKILLQKSLKEYEGLATTLPSFSPLRKLISAKIRKTGQLLQKINNT